MREWSDTPELNKLLKSLASGTAESGLKLTEQILRLQGKLPVEELQEAYVDGLLALLRRTPGANELEEIERRLRNTPAYAQNPTRVEEHAQALASAAADSRSLAQGRLLADSIARLKGYGSSLSLQKAHADALFELSDLPESAPLEMAEKIAAIPSFRDEAQIQFAYARVCCNATTRDNPKIVDQAVAQLAALPLRSESSDIEESYQRALRNRERLHTLRATSPSSSPRNVVKSVGAVVVGLALAGAAIVAFESGDRQALPSTSPTVAVADPRQDLAREIEQAAEALRKGDNDRAITLGLKARQLADSLRDSQSQSRAIDVVGTAYFAMGDKGRAVAQWDNILQADLPGVLEGHLAAAEQALSSGDKAALSSQLGALSSLETLFLSPPDRPLLERLAVIYEKGGQPLAAAKTRESMGDFARAAQLAEAAGAWDQALKLWVALAQKDPSKKSELSSFRLRAGERAVKAAETAFTKKDLANARQQAKSALEILQGANKSGEPRARALTVLAKVAYQEETYPEAVALAKDAYTAAANPDRRARLDAYRLKDAQIVTRDELDVDTFVFPPPVKSSKYYTYAYWLGPDGDYVSGGTEELFSPPKDELTLRLAYQSPEQGVSVGLTTHDARSYSFSFDAGRDARLQPGSYDGATRFPFNMINPGLDFSGNGRGSNQSRGRFVVHEIEWTDDGRLTSFAADFILAGENRSKGVYGKVRYNSRYE